MYAYHRSFDSWCSIFSGQLCASILLICATVHFIGWQIWSLCHCVFYYGGGGVNCFYIYLWWVYHTKVWNPYLVLKNFFHWWCLFSFRSLLQLHGIGSLYSNMWSRLVGIAAQFLEPVCSWAKSGFYTGKTHKWTHRPNYFMPDIQYFQVNLQTLI